MKRFIGLFFAGIAWGCMVFVVVSLIFMIGFNSEVISKALYIKYAIASMIVGVGFTLPSIVYDKENLSLFLKGCIHMGIGFIIYFPVAYFVGWLPVELGIFAIIFTMIFMLIASLIIWIGFYFYHKDEARKINKIIQAQQEKNKK